MPRWRSGSCALLALILPLAAAAQEILLDFRSADLSSVVDSIARQTGQRFVHDDTLRGNVTISVPWRASREEALRVLDAALLLHGFAAVPGPARSRKIVRIESAPGSSPWLIGPAASGSEAAVTTLIRLQRAPASEIARALRELAGKSAVLSEDPATNSILIAASEAQVRRLLHLARALDQASERELRVLPLRYRSAADMEPMLEEALADEDGLAEAVLVVADERTGSLVVEGRREDMERVRALLRSLDVPLPGKHDLHVVRVLNADATELAESLDGLLQEGAMSRGATGESGIRIAVDEPTHSLVIQASPTEFAEIARVIAELDVPPPRVSVELTVVEASLTGDISLAFDSLLAVTGIPDDAADLAEHGAVIVGTGVPGNLIGTPELEETFVGRVVDEPIIIEVGGIPIPIRFGGIVRAEAGEARFHTLLQPHLLMTSGDEHSIQAGDNIPVPVSTAEATAGADGATPVVGSSGLTTDVTFQRQDTGVDLRMTPTVLSDTEVVLQLELSVSELASSSPELGPTIRSRDVSATARLRDGEVALIAALRAPVRGESRTGVPYLSRIPVLGQFLTVRREVQRRTALIITAQPTLLGSPADEQARSIRQRLAFERQVARTADLSSLTDAPYALLIDTRDSRDAASTAAAELRDLGSPVQVVPWRSEQREYWDVYATGFETLGAASAASIALRDAGWQPQLTVLPRKLE